MTHMSITVYFYLRFAGSETSSTDEIPTQSLKKKNISSHQSISLLISVNNMLLNKEDSIMWSNCPQVTWCRKQKSFTQ